MLRALLHKPTSHKELATLEQEQLMIVGRRFDGKDRSAASRFRNAPISKEERAEGIDWDDGNLLAHRLERWEIFEDGRPIYDLWLHHADSGCAFVHGKTEIVAEMCQSTWMKPGLTEKSELGRRLRDALEQAEKDTPRIEPSWAAKKKSKRA